MTSDLVKRLREARNFSDVVGWLKPAADRIEELARENIQMRFALGYPMPADLEHLVVPSNPFRCGTCDAKARRIEELEWEQKYMLTIEKSMRAAADARREALEEVAGIAMAFRNSPDPDASDYYTVGYLDAVDDIAAAIRRLMEKKDE